MESRKPDPRWPSAIALVVANLVPVYGVVVWGWSVQPLLAIYWAETVLIGALALLRALCARPGVVQFAFLKLIALPFLPIFLIPYGMVVVILAFFTFGMFGTDETRHAFLSLVWAASDVKDLLPPGEALRVLGLALGLETGIAFAALALSHLVSFFWNYLARGECHRAGFRELVAQPLVRIFLLTSVLIAAAFVGGQRPDTPVFFLLPLIALKIGLDLAAHLREHREVT